MISYSQNFEDVYIYRAFKDVSDGFYIDVGAYDPDEDSVTKLFYDLGWRGVNVEPGPSFERFVRDRPRDINLQLAVVARPGVIPFFFHEGDPGTSTTKTRLHPTLKDRVGARREIQVQGVTLTHLLEQHGANETIRFLKLDIEGMEAPVVASVDWTVHRPELVITEATRPYTNERIDKAWSPVFKKAGYELVFFDGINTYYLREESRARRSAFRSPINVLDGFVKFDRRIPEMMAELAKLKKAETDLSERVTPALVGGYDDRPVVGDALASTVIETARGNRTEHLTHEPVHAGSNGLDVGFDPSARERELAASARALLEQAVLDAQLRSRTAEIDSHGHRERADAMTAQAQQMLQERDGVAAQLKLAQHELQVLKGHVTGMREEHAHELLAVQRIWAEQVARAERAEASVVQQSDRADAAGRELIRMGAELDGYREREAAAGRAVEAARAQAGESARMLVAVRAETQSMLDSAFSNVRSEAAAMQMSLVVAEAKLSESEQVMAQLQAEAQRVPSLEADLASLTVELGAAELRLEMSRAEHAILFDAALERSTREIKRLEASLSETRSELVSMTETAFSSRKAEAQAREELRTLGLHAELLSRDVQTLQTRLDLTHSEQAILLDAMMERPSREIEILETTLASTRAELARATSMTADLLERDRQTKAATDALVKRAQQLEADLERSRATRTAETGALQREADTLRARVAELTTRQAQLTDQLARARLDEGAMRKHTQAAVTPLTIRINELMTYQEQLKIQADNIRQTYDGVVRQHELLIQQHEALSAERYTLYNHLRLSEGPRALKTVLPIARLVRAVTGKKPPQGGPPSAGGSAPSGGGRSSSPAGSRTVAPKLTTRNRAARFMSGILRVTVVPVALWGARRFPNLTRSVWMDVRARAPDAALLPPSAPPEPRTIATSAGADDPVLARRVQEALLSLTLHAEMQQVRT